MDKTSIESRIVQVISKELEHERQERQRVDVNSVEERGTDTVAVLVENYNQDLPAFNRVWRE